MQQSFDLAGQQELKAIPLFTIFHNSANGYLVAKVRVVESTLPSVEDEVTITGYFPDIHHGETYSFKGQLRDHPRFGQQFQVEFYQKDVPQTREGLIQYLSSDLFTGIGKKTAEAIVDTLGDAAISVILADKSSLDRVPKLSKDKATSLYEALQLHQGMEEIMIALNQYGFGPQLSLKIYQAYEQETLSVLQQNPYKLIEDVDGIGFNRADELGGKLGMSDDHPDRIKAAIFYVCDQSANNEGHAYLTLEQVVDRTKPLLQSRSGIVMTDELIVQQLHFVHVEKKLIVEDGLVFLPSIYYAEKQIVKQLKRLLVQDDFSLFSDADFLQALGELEERLKLEYAEQQRDAIRQALDSPVMILTGGPGTGKTTVIKGIVELYGELHGISLDPKDYDKDDPYPLLLVAPTGRAAKRMSESTGLPAVTIHRLLGFQGAEGFSHSEDNPVAGKLLIVDESSMVDVWLMAHLLKSLPERIQVIFVGDEDQLPSVGPGQVLRDLLASEAVPIVRLEKIYRQQGGSSIIDLAHAIKQGGLPADLTVKQKDRSFISCEATHLLDVVRQVTDSAVKKGFTKRDIQVLAPMYRGPAGIDALNLMLQELFNPKAEKRRQLMFGEVAYRVGDKVLQLVNQPDANVFNGDMGEIVSIFYAKENTENEDLIVIDFDGNEVTYKRADFSQFTHAYACSIHKSQGSEFPIVIMPVVKSYYRMLRRNLLYTGITRSKQFLILCGQVDAFQQGIARTDDSRQTTLTARLAPPKVADEPQEITEAELVAIDPNIGMENITPFHFMEQEAN